MKPLTFAERLKESRQAAKLTQKQAADRVGMAQATLSQLEGGKYPTSALTPRLAHLYGVHARWLADGVGPRHLTDAAPQDDPAGAAAETWPFSASREDFEKLRPVDRRALDKTLTRFIAGTLASYESEEMKRNSAAIQGNELKPSGTTIEAMRRKREAARDAADGRDSHEAAGPKKRSGGNR